MPVNYVRVYGGWEERLNPNYFQRQAWFRQRSRRMNPVATGKNGEVRRSASEESLLDSSSDPPPAPPRRNKALAHNFEQTPPYPSTKSAALMKPRRIDLSTSKCVADGDADRTAVENDTSASYPALNYRKDSNAKSAAVPSADNYLLERWAAYILKNGLVGGFWLSLGALKLVQFISYYWEFEIFEGYVQEIATRFGIWNDFEEVKILD